MDIWAYTKRENIPVIPLYFSNGGNATARWATRTSPFPVDSDASTLDEILAELAVTKTSERSGRAMDHESEDASSACAPPDICEASR